MVDARSAQPRRPERAEGDAPKQKSTVHSARGESCLRRSRQRHCGNWHVCDVVVCVWVHRRCTKTLRAHIIPPASRPAPRWQESLEKFGFAQQYRYSRDFSAGEQCKMVSEQPPRWIVSGEAGEAGRLERHTADALAESPRPRVEFFHVLAALAQRHQCQLPPCNRALTASGYPGAACASWSCRGAECGGKDAGTSGGHTRTLSCKHVGKRVRHESSERTHADARRRSTDATSPDGDFTDVAVLCLDLAHARRRVDMKRAQWHGLDEGRAG